MRNNSFNHKVWETDQGTLKGVVKEIRRGRHVKCSYCSQRGATIGCRVPRCNVSYHHACAQAAGATPYPLSYLMSCPEHARWYKKQEQQELKELKDRIRALGAQKLSPMNRDSLNSPPKLAKSEQPPNKRRRGCINPDQRISDAKAALERMRREGHVSHRYGSSDDETEFTRKEACRLEKDTCRLNSITLGSGNAMRCSVRNSPLPKNAAVVEPQQQVESISNCDFDSMGGAEEVIRTLKEVVVLPLLYPEIFASMGISPPRGILFHGPPGTGKTLAARAVAGACAKRSPVPVTLFARRGADCLGKFHGEAERTLRLLFEEAKKKAPSIIFLDEIDALAPNRAARAGGTDQIYASVVSTLLSLMDGVVDRGGVIVIAATNRPEAIDSALRRPGRFDREVFFPLPGPYQRLEILKAHTKQWKVAPGAEVLARISQETEGYAGADLQALCTGVVMAAVKRVGATVLNDLLDGTVSKETLDTLLEGLVINEEDWFSALEMASLPCSKREGLTAVSPLAGKEHLAPYLWPLLQKYIEQSLHSMRQNFSVGVPLPLAFSQGVEAELKQSGGLHSMSTSMSHFNEIDGQVPQAHPSYHTMNKTYNQVRLLMLGDGELGQEAGAATLLKLFEGCPICTLSLPSLLMHGAGDATSGCVSLVSEALRRAEKKRPTIFYLNRMETWGLTVSSKDDDLDLSGDWAAPQSSSKSAESPFGGLQNRIAVSPNKFRRDASEVTESPVSPTDNLVELSEVWSVLESMLLQASRDTPLVLLATCHFSLADVPGAVKQFFGAQNIVSYADTTTEECWSTCRDIAGRVISEQVAASAANFMYEHLCTEESSHTKKLLPSVARNRPEVGFDEIEDRDVVKGAFILDQIATFIRGIGQQLLKDPRCKEASSWKNKQRKGRKQWCSFASVAHKAASGAYPSLEDLVQGVAGIVSDLQTATGINLQKLSPTMDHHRAVSVACTLQDEIESKCHVLTSRLRLDDIETKDAIQIASKRAKEVERKERAAHGVVDQHTAIAVGYTSAAVLAESTCADRLKVKHLGLQLKEHLEQLLMEPIKSKMPLKPSNNCSAVQTIQEAVGCISANAILACKNAITLVSSLETSDDIAELARLMASHIVKDEL